MCVDGVRQLRYTAMYYSTYAQMCDKTDNKHIKNICVIHTRNNLMRYTLDHL